MKPRVETCGNPPKTFSTANPMCLCYYYKKRDENKREDGIQC
jgi:hypothetical protein